MLLDLLSLEQGQEATAEFSFDAQGDPFTLPSSAVAVVSFVVAGFAVNPPPSVGTAVVEFAASGDAVTPPASVGTSEFSFAATAAEVLLPPSVIAAVKRPLFGPGKRKKRWEPLMVALLLEDER